MVAARPSGWFSMPPPPRSKPRTRFRSDRPKRWPMALDILIVDDEADIRLLIAGILSDEGSQTRQAHDSVPALADVRARQPSLALLDIWLQCRPTDVTGEIDRESSRERVGKSV